MNITIKSLKVSRSSDSHIRIALKQDGCQYENVDTFFCVSRTEWPMVRACMMGFAEVYPYFDDGLYLMKFSPQGMRVVHTSGNKDDLIFIFPCNELVEYIDYVFNNTNPNWRDNKDFLSVNDYDKCIIQWQHEYGPKVIIKVDADVKDRLAVDIINPLLKTPGKDLIADLTRWASRYSDGNPISVNITFDCVGDIRRHPEYPTSYYWWIWDEDNQVRIVNGGYIAHSCGTDEQPLFEYSMHT